MVKWASRRRIQLVSLAGIILIFRLGFRRGHSDGEWDRTDTTQHHISLGSIRPHESSGHSRTFGIVDKIYVISNSKSIERRKVVDALARALDFDFTYVNATDILTPGEGKEIVENILDRIRWQRPRIDERVALASEVPTPIDEPNSKHIRNAFPFEWSEDTVDNADDPLAEPLGISGADYWSIQPLDQNWERQNPLPKLTLEERTVKILSASRTNSLLKKSFIPTATIAIWHSHVRVLRDIVEKQHQSAIIFEDVIDLEWDIEQQLRGMWSALPAKWDIVHIGYCAGNEYKGEALEDSFRLRKTVHTLCSYAYAVSLRGAAKLSRFLRSPDYAYSRSIDQAIKDLIQMGHITSFSIYPPLVSQTSAEMGDVKAGVDLQSKVLRGEMLLDSTLERIGLYYAALRGGTGPGEVEWEEYEPY